LHALPGLHIAGPRPSGDVAQSRDQCIQVLCRHRPDFIEDPCIPGDRRASHDQFDGAGQQGTKPAQFATDGGFGGGKAGAAYTASKHGLIGLTRNIAATYGPDGIRCVAIAPGAVKTGISIGGEPSKRGYATLEKTLASIPRMGEAVEIANLAAFLASDEASFLNGAVVTADAGWTVL